MLCLLLDVHTLPCRLTLSSTGYHSASLTHVRGGGGGDGGSMQAEADQGAAKRRKFPTTESESSSMLEEEGGEPFDVAGAAIDEWNPSASKPGQPPSTFTNNSAAAAAGYTMGKKEWPWAFTAGWVTGQDAMFTSLMLEGSFDLAIVEGYSFNPESGGACGKACFLSRLARFISLATNPRVLPKVRAVLARAVGHPDWIGGW